MLTPDHIFVKQRRNGSTIYRCPDNTHYLKVGNYLQIESEVSTYQLIRSYGFPLPDIIEHKLIQGETSSMKEEVIPGVLFADIFTQDCDDCGSIGDHNYQLFCAHNQRHLALQMTTESLSIGFPSFAEKWNILREENQLSETLIEEVKTKISDISQRLPSGWNHGDYNPYNIFMDGIIDLEDNFYGLIGYDTMTAITQNYWFPTENCEMTQQHRFTSDQIVSYLQTMSSDQLNFYDNDIFATLTILRGIFVTIQTDIKTLSQWRYLRLQEFIEQWLSGANTIDYFVEHYRSSMS